MTIQQDATTRNLPPTPQPTKSQIETENAAAAASEGYLPPVPPGASDNLNEGAPQTPEQRAKSVADQVRDQQAAAADDREDFMASIAERRRQHMAGEESDDDSLDFPDESQENQHQEQETDVAQDAPAVQDVPEAVEENRPRFFTDANGQEVCELLVNGEKRIVPAERVFAAAQKLEAGDQRLQEAAQQRAQLEADIIRFNAQQKAARTNPQPSVDPDAAAKERAQLRERIERLVNEGDDNAIDGLVEILAESRKPTIDPHQLALEAARINNQTAWDSQLALDLAEYNSSQEFADITGNTLLDQKAAGYAKQLTADLQARDLNIRPIEIMRRACNMVREEGRALAQAYGLQLPGTTQQAQSQTQPVASREEAVAARKQQLGNTVTGGAVPRSDVSQERKAAPDGGRNPSSLDSKAAAFAGLNSVRTNPAIKR